jgi:hypothetical protein
MAAKKGQPKGDSRKVFLTKRVCSKCNKQIASDQIATMLQIQSGGGAKMRRVWSITHKSNCS